MAGRWWSGVVPDRLQVVLEDGRRIESEVNSRPDIGKAFPNVKNGSAAGYRFSIPKNQGGCAERRFQLVASIGTVERFHCLIVDQHAGSDETTRGAHWLRDGVLIV